MLGGDVLHPKRDVAQFSVFAVRPWDSGMMSKVLCAKAFA